MVDVTPNKDGGVLKEIITPGDGDCPPNGSTISCHYHGTLEDGTIFDSSVQRGQPFEFKLGGGTVIKAWDIGVATMRKNEKSKFTCRADYAYGDSGSPPKIPGGATLIFEITLLSWKEEDLSKDKDGGILRSILKPGEGWTTPNDYALCKIHLKGWHNEHMFDDREVNFHLGEGDLIDVPFGVERVIEKMNKEEKSKVTLSPKYGFPKGNEKFSIPSGATLKYEVTLIEFEKMKESWSMDAIEKLEQSQMFKEKATAKFQLGQYQYAATYYKKAVSYIDSDSGFNESEEVQRKALLLALQLNLGMCFLKLNQDYEAKKHCDEALKIDSNNVKGLFRRGQALLNINEPQEAHRDFTRVLELEPNNKAASAQLAICVQKMKELRAKEKQIYANMFDKFAQKDREDTYRFGWWDDSKKTVIITEKEEDCSEKQEELRKEKQKQIRHLKKLAEAKRKEREEREQNENDGEKSEGEANSTECGGNGFDVVSGGVGEGREGETPHGI